jgi:hypothetical protein
VREVAFSIIDMNDKGWPQLLDVDRQVQLLLPNLVENLGMPRQLNYMLIPKGTNLPLDGRHTLAEYRIPGGAELYLRPLRDHLLKMFLDKLYDEVKDQIKEHLIDSAKEKLKQILQLDPTYPDPFRFKERLLGAVPQPPLYDAAVRQLPYQQKQPKQGSGKGCLIAGILGGGAVLLLGGMIVLSILVLPALKTRAGQPQRRPALSRSSALGMYKSPCVGMHRLIWTSMSPIHREKKSGMTTDSLIAVETWMWTPTLTVIR